MCLFEVPSYETLMDNSVCKWMCDITGEVCEEERSDCEVKAKYLKEKAERNCSNCRHYYSGICYWIEGFPMATNPEQNYGACGFEKE